MGKPKKSSKEKSEQNPADAVLFARIPMGFRELYVPYPSNPNVKSSGRLMIPFPPMGKGRANGNGLPMTECLAQQGLRGPEDPVFTEEAAAGKKFVTFTLTWPGYYPQVNWNMQIPLFGPSGLDLTRGELAWTVANQYRLLYEKCCADTSIQSSDPAWRLGPGGYTFDTLRLAALWTSGQDIWRASVMVLTPIDLGAWARAGMVLTLPKQMQSAAPTSSLSIGNSTNRFESDTGFDDLDEFNTEWGTPTEEDWGDDGDFVV